MAKFSETIDYLSIDGNAYSIMGHVAKAIRKSGGTEADVSEYHDDATSGDYEHLLATSLAYIGQAEIDEDDDYEYEDDYCLACGEHVYECQCD